MNNIYPINPNDWAFPVHADTISRCGLTKRELFAAMAMQGILSNSSVFNIMQEMVGKIDPSITVSLAAIEHADALINALNDQK